MTARFHDIGYHLSVVAFFAVLFLVPLWAAIVLDNAETEYCAEHRAESPIFCRNH